MPEVLMLARDDHANTGWRFFKCIQSLGIDIIALKGKYHPMAYPEQIPIHPAIAAIRDNCVYAEINDLIAYACKAKVIHYIGSVLIACGVDLEEKKVVMQHGGTTYRNNHEILNEAYNNFVDATIIQCPDLLGLGAKNERWIYYPVDTDYIKPDFKTNDKLVIGHFPSNPNVKGTKAIIRVIEKLERDTQYKNRFKYIGCSETELSNGFANKNLVYWKDNLQRLKKCDIIIETLSMDINGRVYGEWGNTTLEAAALGKIVITNSLTTDKYLKEFGTFPHFYVANNKDTLERRLKNILDLSKKEIIYDKKASRAWVERNHSMPVTAQRIWDKVYRHLL